MGDGATVQPAFACGGVRAFACGWQYRAPSGELPPGDLHLWALDLNFALRAEFASASCLTLLSAAELAAAERQSQQTQRARYLGGRLGLRMLLCAYTGLGNQVLRFGSGRKGKPFLCNSLGGREFCFNYTLSGDQALYAVAWNRRVGIDLESLPRAINAPLLAKRKLAKVEQRAWRTVAAPWREQAMLACWTRKEAYGKALGVGIRYTLNQVPLFVDLNSPRWQCRVSGLFDAKPTTQAVRPAQLEQHQEPILHGLQIVPPFSGIAALMHDGDALTMSGNNVALQTWHWAPSISEVDSLAAAFVA